MRARVGHEEGGHWNMGMGGSPWKS